MGWLLDSSCALLAVAASGKSNVRRENENARAGVCRRGNPSVKRQQLSSCFDGRIATVKQSSSRRGVTKQYVVMGH